MTTGIIEALLIFRFGVGFTNGIKWVADGQHVTTDRLSQKHDPAHVQLEYITIFFILYKILKREAIQAYPVLSGSLRSPVTSSGIAVFDDDKMPGFICGFAFQSELI